MEHDTKFYKFIEYVNSSRKKVLVGLMFLVLIGAMWTAFEQRVSIITYFITTSETATVSDAQFRQMVKLNSLIQTRLNVLRDNTGASRVVVRQFHNGRQDLTAVPFEKVTDVFESHAPNFKLMVDTDRTLPMATITYSLGKMWGENASNPECYGIETESYPQGDYRGFLQQHGIKYLVACPITNIAQYPLGTLSIGLPFIPTDKEIADGMAATKAAADKTGGYLELLAEVKRGE